MVDLVLLSLPDWVDANPKMYFPLSLMYLASSVREAGFTVQLLDCRDGIKNLPQAEFYGFSCATPQILVAKELARQITGKTIIGGAHASLLPNDCVKHFDYVVIGEGERVIVDILNGEVENGIVEASRIHDLDNIPFPAWDLVESPFSDTLFPGERYGKGELASTIIGSRGCPFNCAFCGNIHQRPVYYRSANNIISELQELVKRGVRHFRFADDNFTIIPEFKKLCYRMSEMDIHYKCHTRSDLLTEDKAKTMVYSGCEECGLGVESADDYVLDKVNKRETVDDHLRATKILKDAGLRVKSYFVTGLPGETDRTIEENKAFVTEAKIDKWTVSTFTPYPGCPIYKSPGKYGVEILNNDWSKWWNYCTDGYNHILLGQTREEMWNRYLNFYNWLRGEK